MLNVRYQWPRNSGLFCTHTVDLVRIGELELAVAGKVDGVASLYAPPRALYAGSR